METNKYSSLQLAFIGDAHYNLVVKRDIIDKEVKVNDLQSWPLNIVALSFKLKQQCF